MYRRRGWCVYEDVWKCIGVKDMEKPVHQIWPCENEEEWAIYNATLQAIFNQKLV